jgi:cell filamentation protein
MNRYDAGDEGEYEPGSRGRVLRNKLGIRSAIALDQVEAELLLKSQQRYFGRISAETVFTTALICEMHADWLASVFHWAGKYRTVNVSKGGFAWPPAGLVAQNMGAFEARTLRRLTPCRPGDLDEVCAALAEVQAELLLVHPFREGNGRTARWVTDLMAQQAGLPALHYLFRGRGRRREEEEYLAAVRAGYAARYEPLAAFLRRAVERALRGLD